jgi:hypothetical protein
MRCRIVLTNGGNKSVLRHDLEHPTEDVHRYTSDREELLIRCAVGQDSSDSAILLGRI